MRRLPEIAPAVGSHEEAYELLCRLLNDVEDELTETPFDPPNWETDQRLYPPQEDHATIDEARPGVTQYRSRKHYIDIAENGAILIQHQSDAEIVFNKPGRDGHGVR